MVVLFHDLPEPALELPRLREAIARTYTGSGGAPWRAPTRSLRPPDGREIVTGSILIRKEPPGPRRRPDAALPDPKADRARRL